MTHSLVWGVFVLGFVLKLAESSCIVISLQRDSIRYYIKLLH